MKAATAPSRRRPRVADSAPRERQELAPGNWLAPIAAAVCI